jgi:hypothetical protein
LGLSPPWPGEGCKQSANMPHAIRDQRALAPRSESLAIEPNRQTGRHATTPPRTNHNPRVGGSSPSSGIRKSPANTTVSAYRAARTDASISPEYFPSGRSRVAKTPGSSSSPPALPRRSAPSRPDGSRLFDLMCSAICIRTGKHDSASLQDD